MLKKILRVTSSVKKLNQMGNEKKTIHCTTQVTQHRHRKRKKSCKSVIFSIKGLRWALAAALTSTLLFILGSYQAGIVPAASPSSQWLMTAGHLLAAFGNSVLLWGAIRVFCKMTKRKDRWPSAAAVLVMAYHLSAALGYVLAFRYGFLTVTLLMWTLKTLLCCAVTFDFMTLGDGLLAATGLTLLIACIAGCPFALPDGWGTAQWVVAKLAALLLPLLLYWNSADETGYNY